ncbi:ADP-ribosylation factor-binding protein GGA1 isoform X2 [Ceratitis capitata]|uniref:ADP-ribosylation factor-binding protein GGA1 n=1 Tax=Ceratitis capitata TaxID=7213 RepID=W8CAW9_CERCA|nr:ADP-ribosylation factor-binding protein GGA1 isoform X2 [Ceratitis capitata]
MTTNESIMEEMLDRATNPIRESVDELSSQMFCMVVRSNPQLVDRSQEMIMLKVRSNNVTESTRAITLLEECMNKCGTEFQDEASKFRFLNQLIRLVSKKYQGAQTPAPIKKRIMECLLLWTTEHPQKVKIREVYEMLCKEGGVEHVVAPSVESKRESVLGIDEEMLAKLINSKDPENYKRANLLIQNRVKQEARRRDLIIQHKNILQEVSNTVCLLDEMLNIYETEGNKNDEESESMNVIRELYQACKKHKPIMERLPELMENIDESLIVEAVENNEALQNVIKRYKCLVGTPTKKTTREIGFDQSNINKSQRNEEENVGSTNIDLLSDLLGSETRIGVVSPATDTTSSSIVDADILGATRNSVATREISSSTNPLDDLHEIFAEATKNINMSENVKRANEIFSNSILEPISTLPTPLSGTKADGSITPKEADMVADKYTFRKMPTIDKLSEDLFQESLRDLERVYSFKKGPEKHTLNDLAEEKIKDNIISCTQSKTQPSDKISEKFCNQQMDDDNILKKVSDKEEDDLILPIKNDENTEPKSETPQTTSLAEIEVDLDKVDPEEGERVLWDDDDIKVMLSFTKDRPRKEVSVIVISVHNKSKLPVHNFRFDASVHKPCKVRLLSPTAASMAPHKPFRPAIPINQVMLLLNPTGRPTDITCFLGYNLGDDPDPIKESNVAKDIPYVE